MRPLVLCVVLLGAVLGAAGCSSPGTSAPHAPLGKPTGTVTVRSGGKVVCVITLDKNGTGTCKVSTKGFKPGSVSYTGTYSGGGGLNPTQSKPVSVKILKAK